jgi:hypothetical protein
MEGQRKMISRRIFFLLAMSEDWGIDIGVSVYVVNRFKRI